MSVLVSVFELIFGFGFSFDFSFGFGFEISFNFGFGFGFFIFGFSFEVGFGFGVGFGFSFGLGFGLGFASSFAFRFGFCSLPVYVSVPNFGVPMPVLKDTLHKRHYTIVTINNSRAAAKAMPREYAYFPPRSDAF